MNTNKKAFTLAELLIAMLMFAILAVMLIPNVSNNAEKELYITQTKKVQNDIQQALLLLMSQNQGTLRGYCAGGSTSKCLMDRIAKNLEKHVAFSNEDLPNNNVCTSKIKERSNIKDAQDQACRYKLKAPQFINKKAAEYNAHNNNNNQNNSFYAVNLKNGATISALFIPGCGGRGNIDWPLTDIIEPTSPPNNDEQTTNINRICGYMEVDVNASKVPNMVGKDIHYFWIIDQDGLVPFGEIDTFTCADNQKDTGVQATSSLGCTYRMLQKGRIDYF